jgi:hypothetical protein
MARRGDPGEAGPQRAVPAQVALGGAHGHALGALDGGPDALPGVGGVGRRHGDEHIKEAVLHGQDAVGGASDPTRAGVIGIVAAAWVATAIAVVAALGGPLQHGLVLKQVGDVVHADGEERPQALDRGGGVDYVADGKGYIGQD